MSKLKPFSIYRHHSGRRYFLLGIANEKSAKPEFPPLAVYFNTHNYTLWARSVEEFADESKFTVASLPVWPGVGAMVHEFICKRWPEVEDE